MNMIENKFASEKRDEEKILFFFLSLIYPCADHSYNSLSELKIVENEKNLIFSCFFLNFELRIYQGLMFTELEGNFC